VSEEVLDIGQDCIIDPAGNGPRFWLQVVPEAKAVKNRLHLDISVGGGREFPIETRRQQVDAEAERLAGLGASFVRALSEEAPTTTESLCGIPRATSSASTEPG
jgi:Glyoxalase-like domain